MAKVQSNTRQNVSFHELISWSEKNPNRSKSLTPIEICTDGDILRMREMSSKDENTLETIRLPNFESVTLTPSGILSAIAYATDTVYQNSSAKARQILLRDFATRLQIETDKLVGTALGRKRRKIHDGIGALSNSSAVKPEDWLDLFSSLAIMNNVQLIFVQLSKVEITETDYKNALKNKSMQNEVLNGDNESDDDETFQKTIYFSHNPTLWSKTKQTWIVDYYGRWIATPQNDENMSDIVDWMDDIEIYGWKVMWPDYSSFTKEDIVKQLSGLPSWKPEHSKLKKDTLVMRFAKYTTIKALTTIFE
jgi:hypothetical protein